jgi:hypothetical protein
MKRKLLNASFAIIMAVFGLTTTNAQVNVTVSGSANWLAYANVFNLNGGYEFGSPWGLGDVKSVPSAANNTLTLYPNYNTYNANDPYWSNGAGLGNKNFEGNTFVENAALAGQSVTFSGFVVSSTLVAGYERVAFLKALDPANNYADAFNGTLTAPLVAGQNFSITANNIPAGLIVQYGFRVFGRNGNPANEAANGNVVVGPSTLGINSAVKNTFSIYPNPTSSQINIDTIGEINSIEIHNLLGQKVLQSSSNNKTLEVSSLNSGVYLISVTVDNETTTKRFLKN